MMEYFCAYHSMLGATRKLSDAECGRLFRALLAYSSGEQPDNLQGREELLFDVFAQQIDRDRERYEKKCMTNKANGRGRKRSQANGSVRDQEKEKEKDKEKDKYFLACEGVDEDLETIAAANNAALDLAERLGLDSSIDLEQANRLSADYGAEWLIEALNRTAKAPKSAHAWRYIEGILRRWRQNGGIDAEQAQSQKNKTKTVRETVIVDGEEQIWEHEVSV